MLKNLQAKALPGPYLELARHGVLDKSGDD
jgi:hypothetical protein